MACFLVPLTIGVILKIIKKLARNTAEKLKLDTLTTMMLGGSLVLAIEHIWHGEVVPWPPFLTAMNNPSEIPVMLYEMATAGSALTLAITGVWASILLYHRRLHRMVKTHVVKPLTTTVKQ